MAQPKPADGTWMHKQSESISAAYDQTKEFAHSHMSEVLYGAGAVAVIGAAIAGRGKIIGIAEKLFPKASELLDSKPVSESVTGLAGNLKALMKDKSFVDEATRAAKAAENDRPKGLGEAIASSTFRNKSGLMPFESFSAPSLEHRIASANAMAEKLPPADQLRQMRQFLTEGSPTTDQIDKIFVRHIMLADAPAKEVASKLTMPVLHKLESLADLKRAISAHPRTSPFVRGWIEAE